jgi:hypothetical protein
MSSRGASPPTGRIWYLDVSKPSAARRVPGVGADAHQPAFSAAGDLLYTRWFFRRQLRGLPLKGAGQADSPAQPLVISTRADRTPRIARDGSHIVFQADRSGSFEIWIARADGSNLRKMTSFDGPPAGSPDLSPDNASIVFDRIVDGQRDIFIRCALLQRRTPRRLGENDAWIVATVDSIDADMVGADRAAFRRLGARYLRFR